MNTPQEPSEANQFHEPHVALLLDSYQRLLKRPLLEETKVFELGRQIFFAEFALLSHDTRQDPIFNYANKAALDLFELSWADLISLPSRLSAEPVNQEERERSLIKVMNDGYIEGYSGIRVSKNGKRFLIRKAVVWNVLDSQGSYHGQAAYFDEWTWL
ncbi:MAG: MEKHLA domain-containing protein [Gammaproteobacteria bacterium]